MHTGVFVGIGRNPFSFQRTVRVSFVALEPLSASPSSKYMCVSTFEPAKMQQAKKPRISITRWKGSVIVRQNMTAPQ